MYLTYIEYIEMGGTLDETAFDDLSFEAESIIKWWTFNRLDKEETIPKEVKKCMFKLISLINNKQQAMVVDIQSSDGTIQAGIASESNDGVSTNYNTLSASEAVETFQTAIESTIGKYLQGVRNSLGHKLLYRGIYPDE